MRNEEFDETIVPDKWLYFELMDRSHILCNHMDTAFFNHPGLDAEHAKMASDATALIAEIYQWAGTKLSEVTVNES